MVVTIPEKPLTFEAFLAQYGKDDRYELIDGELFDLKPTGQHEEVSAEIGQWLNYQIVIQQSDRDSAIELFHSPSLSNSASG
ncbi:MAG: hypothetical protein VKJ24_15695 [Synechococcales bacterium]|nr:hypothetical protein [Synechococcales bacterium]